MQILLITNNVPYPPNSGFPLRVYNLLYRIAEKHKVWLVTFSEGEEDVADLDHLRKICCGVETVVFQNAGALARPLQAVDYVRRGIPPTLRIYESAGMVEKIKQLTCEVDFDIVQIEDSHMSAYLDFLPDSMTPRTVLTFHDVNFDKFERISRLEPKRTRKIRSWLHSRLMRRWEPYHSEKFGHCVAMSNSDRNLLKAVNPKLKIDVIPNGVDTKLYPQLPFPENVFRILFVGNMAYRPNIDAVTFFCESIYPRIKAEFPKIEFWIVGKDPSPEVLCLKGNGIKVTGQVDDLIPYYKDSAVCVAPLRAGGGTRLKILEAMALGRPVVTTSVGCEGLEVKHGTDLFIADQPDQFADYTLQLLKDKQKWLEMTKNARQLAVNFYDWDVIAQAHLNLYEKIRYGHEG